MVYSVGSDFYLIVGSALTNHELLAHPCLRLKIIVSTCFTYHIIKNMKDETLF